MAAGRHGGQLSREWIGPINTDFLEKPLLVVPRDDWNSGCYSDPARRGHDSRGLAVRGGIVRIQ
jgi:hypothetical protein